MLKFCPVNTRFPVDPSYVALLIVDAALLTVIPIEALSVIISVPFGSPCACVICQPVCTARLYVVESDAVVPFLFSNASIFCLSVPDITTVAVVELEGTGSDVSGVKVIFG